MNALSAAFVHTVAKPGRYCDGHGLYLDVQPSGSRSWVQRITIGGRRRELGLGGYPMVPLKDARAQAFANRQLARSGGDPLAEKRRSANVPTFAAAAEQVWAQQKPGWRNEKYTNDWLAGLKRVAFPRLGEKSVTEVKSPDVIDVLRPIWHSSPTTARRVRQRINTVMEWAVAMEYRADNPCERIGPVLGRQQENVQHMAALPHREVAAALEATRTSAARPVVRLAFEFLVLTAARSGEVRGAHWSEIDLTERSWTIPGQRMKTNREHRVPLCRRAVEILEAARTLGNGGALVFPTTRGKQLKDMALSGLLKNLGIPAVPHGFRSSFRDWAGEETNHPHAVIEAALAHMVRNKVEAAYARSDLFERRRCLMDDWAVYLGLEHAPGESHRDDGNTVTVRTLPRVPASVGVSSLPAERPRSTLRPRPSPSSGARVVDAITLKQLYEAQLEDDLVPPMREDVDRRTTRCLLRASRGMTGGELRVEDHRGIWIWSDLHLGHSETITAFRRPFATPEEMDDALFRSWNRTVAPDDTIIVLGDIAIHGLWGRRRDRVLKAPGRKILVIGNHEADSADGIEVDGFDETYSTLCVGGDPPLLMTHIPLRIVPDGCVNLHGHIHHHRVAGRTRHINLSVEQVRYRPRALTSIRRLAARLVQRETLTG